MYRRFLLPALVALSLGQACAAAPPPGAPIQARATAARQAPASVNALYDERDWLERFYAPRAYAPAWNGAGAAQAAIALDLLARADEDGLSGADYRVAAPREDTAGFDTALTLAMLHYLADLHVGRARTGVASIAPEDKLRAFDPVAVLARMLADQHLAQASANAAPQLSIYRRLKTSLAHYRALAQQPMPALAPLPAGRKSIEPGDTYAGAAALRRQLRALGDLAGDAGDDSDERYTPALAAAVARFQDRHGLAADGKLGPQTLAALAVPLTQRVRQIELSLERLRWLPALPPGPVIAINLPSYRLWAYRATGEGATPALAMRVIVGQAALHQTPVFAAQLRSLEFNPYWNVPESILRAEILPALAKNPGYLAQHEMEVVDALGRTRALAGADALAALRAGGLRVRQRPGAQNALGALKFVLPNAMAIYLHSTPARQLFQLARRDFSHGCIRVEDPAALAAFTLADQAQWSGDAIAAAMAPGASRTVQLRKPIPVIIFYTTAIVDHESRVLFPSDIYGFDDTLERALDALAARRATTPALGQSTMH